MTAAAIGIKPDGPWSWLICFGNVIISLSTIGFYRCFSVLYPAVMEEFGVQYSSVSLLSGMFSGAMAFGALLVVIVEKFGCRFVGMVSSIGYSASLFAGAVSSNMTLLTVLCGVCAGFFAGVLLNVMCITCAMYFVKHRSKAAGFAMSGIPLGSLIAAPVLDWLIDRYSWRGAMMMISAIAFHSCAACALYRPVLNVTNEEKKRKSVDDEECMEVHESSDDGVDVEVEKPEKHSKFIKIFDYTLFLKPSYILMFISSTTYWPSNSGAIFLLVPFGMETLNVSRSRASIFLTIQSIGEVFGKIICGPLGDHRKIDRSVLMGIATAFSTLSFFGITFCQSYIAACVVAFLQGLISAFYGGLSIVLYHDIFGLKKMSRAISYEGFTSSVATLPLVYLLGVAIDATGDVKIPYYVCAALMLCCSASLFGIFLIKRSKSLLK